MFENIIQIIPMLQMINTGFILPLFIILSFVYVVRYMNVLSEMTVYHSLSITDTQLFQALKDGNIVPTPKKINSLRFNMTICVCVSAISISLTLFQLGFGS